MYRASFASKTTKRQHTVFEHCLEGRILKENSSLCINADMLKSSSLNACKFTSELNLLFTTSVQRTSFRLNNWNSVASLDAIQIAKTTFLTFQKRLLLLGPQFAGIVKMSNNSKWWNPFVNITRATKSHYGNSQDPREFHEFHTLCWGCKNSSWPRP